MRPSVTAFAALAMLGLLSGCAADPAAAPVPSVEPTQALPTAAPAVLGEAALPLTCAQLMPATEIADFIPDVRLYIDESKPGASPWNIARVQAGELRCEWAGELWGSTGFAPVFEVAVRPSTESALDPAEAFPWLEGYPDELAQVEFAGSLTALNRCDPPYPGYLESGCRAVRLHDGYRIDVHVAGLFAEGAGGRALALLDSIGQRIDTAGPARAIAMPTPIADPAGACREGIGQALMDAVGVAGDPIVRQSVEAPGTDLIDCTWDAPHDGATWVTVLPGGAWAYPRVAESPQHIMMAFEPAASGDFLVGAGDGRFGIRVVGDALVTVGMTSEALEGESLEYWESVLTSAWG